MPLDFPGYAVGGLSVGEDRDAMFETLRHTTDGLPREKPRYFMGIGKPDDLMDCMARGIDMFDCVLATRNGRSGTLFATGGRLNMKNAQYRTDQTLLDAATIGGASSLGQDGRLGRIAAGRPFDACVIDLRHPTLVDVPLDRVLDAVFLAGTAATVSGTFVGGRRIV